MRRKSDPRPRETRMITTSAISTWARTSTDAEGSKKVIVARVAIELTARSNSRRA